MRTARETLALHTTLKSSNLYRKVYLTYWLYCILQPVTTLFYVTFVEAVNNMVGKCIINGRAMNLMFLCISQICLCNP